MGATSFKAYMQITRDELRAAIEEAHTRRLEGYRPSLLGDVCAKRRTSESTISSTDSCVSTDFVADKQPDVCPGQAAGQRTIAALDENGAPFKSLVKKLVDKHVALTSTMTVFETFTPGRPKPPGLDVLLPELKQQFEESYERASGNQQSIYPTLLPKGMALERAFARAGGLLLAGNRSDRIRRRRFPGTRTSVSSNCSSRKASPRSRRFRSGR